MTAAEIAGAVVSYEAGRVLDEVSLTLAAGETYVLLGPNGAGKTTLLRALCGRLRLQAGRVAIEGRDPRNDAAARGRVGFVPQTVALYPKLTVRENLAVFARLAGLDRRRARGRVEVVMEVGRLGEVADRVVGVLSGGTQRRVNIAVALLAEPTVLVLDEPTVGIDLDARSRIHDVLGRLKQGGAATLMTTHDFAEAAALGDRVGFLIGGSLMLEGPPAAVLAQAYGGGKLLEAVLSSPPLAPAEATLRAAGLKPRGDGLVWSAMRDGPAAGAGALYDSLKACGASVREVRLREPGLDTLFLGLIDRERAAP